jgi:hypothetical protein
MQEKHLLFQRVQAPGRTPWPISAFRRNKAKNLKGRNRFINLEGVQITVQTGPWSKSGYPSQTANPAVMIPSWSTHRYLLLYSRSPHISEDFCVVTIKALGNRDPRDTHSFLRLGCFHLKDLALESYGFGEINSISLKIRLPELAIAQFFWDLFNSFSITSTEPGNLVTCFAEEVLATTRLMFRKTRSRI